MSLLQAVEKAAVPQLPDKEPGQHTAAPLEALDLEVTPANVDLPTSPSGESENEVSEPAWVQFFIRSAHVCEKKCEKTLSTSNKIQFSDMDDGDTIVSL